MHELSIVTRIIDIATREAAKAGASAIEEIRLDIGRLAVVDLDAFDFAWDQAIKNTFLEKAVRKIHRPEGKAKCMDCGTIFPVQDLFDPCPGCGGHRIELLEGKELSVRSIVVT